MCSLSRYIAQLSRSQENVSLRICYTKSSFLYDMGKCIKRKGSFSKDIFTIILWDHDGLKVTIFDQNFLNLEIWNFRDFYLDLSILIGIGEEIIVFVNFSLVFFRVWNFSQKLSFFSPISIDNQQNPAKITKIKNFQQ